MFTLKRIQNECVFIFIRYLYRKKRSCTKPLPAITNDKNESKNMDRKIITIGSPESGEKKFKVEIGNGGLLSQQFCVYAWHEQDALDAAVDYCEQVGWDGLFWDDDESVEEYPDDFVTAGNHSHLLRSDCFYVTQLNETKKNKKNTIRLTESGLKKVIAESVKKVLVESNEKDMEIKEKYKEIRNFAIKLCEFTDKHKYGDHFTHGQYMSHRTPTKKEYELRSLLFSLWNDGFKMVQLADAVLKELE